MNYRDASIRTIGDFACGDQLTQLERGRTESPARSCFCDAKHRTIKPIILNNERQSSNAKNHHFAVGSRSDSVGGS